MSLKDLVNSATATFIAELATLPICTVKTCYQTQDTEKNIYKLTKQIYQEHGIKGFYKASMPAVSSQVISTSSKYFLYRFYENKFFKNNTNIKEKIACGWASGVSSTLLTHPIDFFKVKMQVSLRNKNESIVNEFKNNGLSVLYRGYSKSFFKVSIGSMLFYPLTDILQKYIDNIVISSATSAVISTIIMHPLDFLKTRQLKGGIPIYFGLNLANYYKGLSLNLLRIVPHFTMSFIQLLDHNF